MGASQEPSFGDGPQKGEAAPAEFVASRRGFGLGAGACMAAGLAGGYGMFGALAVRYLYPAGDRPKAWMYVARPGEIATGGALLYRAPSGESINIARQGNGAETADFIALSSICPHLGCQVYWESQNNRFFCPCHNGVFDPEGNGTDGPPTGMALLRYPLKVEAGLLYIEVPVDALRTSQG